MHRTLRSNVLALGACALVCSVALASDIHLVAYRFDPLQGEPTLPASLKREPPAPTEAAVFLVQLNGVVTDAARAVVATGGDVLGYIPDNAFLVSGTAGAVTSLLAQPTVRWVGLWHPAYKIAPDIGTHVFVSADRAGSPILLLDVWACGDAARVHADLEASGARVVEATTKTAGHRFAVQASQGAIETLARLSSVLYLEERPEYLALNDTTTWVVQSNQANVRTEWDHGVRGANQMAVVMDTGLDYNSCWFRDPGKTPGVSHRKVKYYQEFGGNKYDGCDLGHGTHVCGTVAGDQTYVNPGATQANGMAPDAWLGVQDIGADDFFSCLLGLVFPPTDLTNAFQSAFDAGARVHTNSWGSTSNAYDGYAVDIDDFIWRRPDFLIFFANGNSGSGSGTVGSPATGKNCVSVGAAKQAPSQEQVTSYSSRGPTSDGRYKPTVCTPGGGDGAANIESADNNTGNPPSNTCATRGLAGTSMATPAAAGCALLVRDYFAQGFYPSGVPNAIDALAPSAALVKAMLINGASDMGSGSIPDNNEGWGRILLNDALFFQGDARELRVEDVSVGLSTGGFAEFTLDVEVTQPLEVTLVWSDFPGTQGAGTALVNDLNLTVTGPSGSFKGNVFAGGQSVAGGNNDAKNVEECVRLNGPAAGTYTVRVDAANVPSGPQRFALVVTGAFVDGLCANQASWSNYGIGLPGTNGIPSFTAVTDPVVGSNVSLALGNSLGSVTAGALFIGFAQASVPGFGGTLLVAPAVALTLAIPGAGLTLSGALPGDVSLCGLAVYLQVLELDGGAVQGVSFTPGLQLVLGS